MGAAFRKSQRVGRRYRMPTTDDRRRDLRNRRRLASGDDDIAGSLEKAQFGALSHREDGLRRLSEAADHQTRGPVPPLDLPKSLGHAHRLSLGPGGEVAVGQRVRDGGALVREVGHRRREATCLRLESRCCVVSDEPGETVEALILKPARAIERVEAEGCQLRCVTNVM